MRRWLLLVVALVLPVLACAPPARAADTPAGKWIVVTAPAFRDALEPLCEHRKAQGFDIEVVQTTDVLTAKEIAAGDGTKLKAHLNRRCRDTKGPVYILLVGAVEAGKLADVDRKVLPPLRGTISRMKDQPCDHGYGCLGNDLQPAAAVGRLPARSEDEARQMVRKTLTFERDRTPGEWRRQVTVLAGAPAFNQQVDALVERIAISRLGKLDPSWSGRAIYHNPQSRFCVPDNQLNDTARKYVEQGQAITLYLGHSCPQCLAAGAARYLDRDDWALMKIARGPGIFATFGCNGCQLCGAYGEGYGVAAVRNPHGPVAVLGSHGICFAALVQLASEGLFESFFITRPPERLGECFLKVKECVARGYLNPITFRLLNAVDGDANIPLATQRPEHVEMFLLLGDPALKLPVLLQDVKLTVADTPAPGKALTIEGEVPGRLAGGKVRLTVERPVTSDPPEETTVPKEPGPERDRAMLARHEQANRFVLLSKDVTVKDGHFAATVTLPEKLPWSQVTVRAYVATDSEDGLGVVVLKVPKPPPPDGQP